MHGSDSQRNSSTLLGSICLSKFQYKQTKSLEQIQRTTINSAQSRPVTKLLELTLGHSFGNDALITSFEICLNDSPLWKAVFQFANVQASCITNRGHYIVMNNVKTETGDTSISIHASAFSQSIKFYLNLKKDFNVFCSDLISLNKQKAKNTQEENIAKVLSYVISSIKIYGFNLHTSPPATQLTRLLNISQGFKKSNRKEEAAQTDILLALCLINARRFIQASQILRRASNYYVNKYNSSKSHLDSSKYERSWMREYEDTNFQESLNMSRNYSTGRVLEGAKYLFKAAKIELLLAETIGHPSLRAQKLQAYNRSNSFFNGNPSPAPLEPNSDIEEVFFKIGPNLIVFLMKVLYDKSEILRITALKSIEFIYETVGCSLSQMIPQLLKTIIITYPSNDSQQNFISASQMIQQSNMRDKNQSDSMSSKSKILIDSYHHLLETFIGLLPLMNKKCLRSIFKEIIVPNVSNQSSSIKWELKLYLLRFSQKILSLCLSDLEITTAFISTIITLSQKKINNSEGIPKYTIHNLSFFSQRIIELLKLKILPRYNNSQHLIPLCSWINENLVYFCQNQLTQQNLQFFSLLIDFVAILYSRPPLKRFPCPIEPIIYFLNMSINQLFLPFESLMNVTILLLRYIKQKNNSEDISQQIIERIIAKSKICTLNTKELKIMEAVLQTFDVCEVSWLVEFLNCIPHSTFDEVYSVFSILLQKSIQNITKPTLQVIIDTLIDQYTVKGKAHELAKNTMISLIKNRNSSLIKNIFEICLTQNEEPVLLNYEPRKKRPKQHNVDSKMYKVDYESFMQKLELFIFFLNKKEESSSEILNLLSFDFIKIIYFALKKLLESKSSKIKQKGLKIIKSLSEIVIKNSKSVGKVELFYIKATVSLLKSFVHHQIESKLQYQAVSNLGMIFNQILKPSEKLSLSGEQSQTDFMDGSIESVTYFEVPFENLSDKIPEIRFRQFAKIYPALINLLNSPWENIRQLIMQTIVQFFSQSLLIYSQNYQKKAVDILRPLVINYIHSQDYTERFAACKLIGCFIGLSREYKSKEQKVQTFSKGSKNIKFLLTQLFCLQQDWNQNTRKIAKLIFQVSLSFQEQEALKRKIQNWKRTERMMQNSYCTFDLNGELNAFENKFQGHKVDKNASTYSINNFQNFETLLKENSRYEDENRNESQFEEFIQIDDKLEQQIGQFKTEILRTTNLKTSFFGDKESFIVENQEDHFFQPNQDRTEGLNQSNKQNKSDEEPLQFQDLGIIDLDDEEWGEQQNQVKITQKLPLKKIYKLSPNVGSSNKHQRIRSKRYCSHQFDPTDKIIVDELQGRINHQKDEQVEHIEAIERFEKTKPNKPNQQRPFEKQYQQIQQSQQFNEDFEQRSSAGIKVESREQISEEKIAQRNDENLLQRPTVSKKTKKTTTKKRKSSIIK